MKTEEPVRVYPIELIFAVAVIGGVIVFALFGQIWRDDGLITGIFSWSRLLTAIAAAGLGFAIGWMVFPRIPFRR